MPAVNDVSVLQPQKEVGLVRDVHLSADGLDEVEGRVVDVGVADDRLALVDGQLALDRHGDGARVVHCGSVWTLLAVSRIP